MAATLGQRREELCARVQQLETGGSLLHMEMQLLQEMLILVSNALPNPVDKERFVASLLAPTLQKWGSAQMQATRAPTRRANRRRRQGPGAS